MMNKEGGREEGREEGREGSRKGQYLYLDESVINIRKFGGYEITLESEA